MAMSIIYTCDKSGEVRQINSEIGKLICERCGSGEVLKVASLAGEKCPKFSGHFDRSSEVVCLRF